MASNTFDEKELSLLTDVLTSLQRDDRFLPAGWSDGGKHGLLPVLDFWDADLLLGQIVYCPKESRFLFVASERNVHLNP